MRSLTLPATALVWLSLAAPALASAGLPKVASLVTGQHQVAIHGDSASLHTGSNLLTVEVPDLPAGHLVTLRLEGPHGQKVLAPLRHLEEVAGEDAHGAHEPAGSQGSSESHGASGGHDAAAGAGHHMMPGMPEMPGMQHGGAAHTENPDVHQGGSYAGRAAFRVDEAGPWQAVLTITGPDGHADVAGTLVEAVQGGPSRVYLGATGSLMAGSMLYGMIQRRRSPGRR